MNIRHALYPVGGEVQSAEDQQQMGSLAIRAIGLAPDLALLDLEIEHFLSAAPFLLL